MRSPFLYLYVSVRLDEYERVYYCKCVWLKSHAFTVKISSYLYLHLVFFVYVAGMFEYGSSLWIIPFFGFSNPFIFFPFREQCHHGCLECSSSLFSSLFLPIFVNYFNRSFAHSSCHTAYLATLFCCILYVF